jgi:hypothetical protein
MKKELFTIGPPPPLLFRFNKSRFFYCGAQVFVSLIVFCFFFWSTFLFVSLVVISRWQNSYLSICCMLPHGYSWEGQYQDNCSLYVFVLFCYRARVHMLRYNHKR